MYWAEKYFYQDQISDNPESKKHWEEQRKKYSFGHTLDDEADRGTLYAAQDGISASDTPEARGSLYTQTDRFLDFNTALEDKRGFLTFGFLVFLPIVLVSLPLSWMVLQEIVTGTDRGGYPIGVIDYMLDIMIFSLGLLPFAGFMYGLYKVGRLEFLTQRRLLVRFDRVNRKVYLHRPAYAGGVVTLDWDKCAEVGLTKREKKKSSDLGVPLCLLWTNDVTPNGLIEMTMVGRMAQSETELYDRWEFIRRFMNEGADTVPPQKTLSKIPMPWNSVMAILSLFWMFGIKGLRFLIPLIVLLTPLILIVAFAHWISLLLCYEPVFPKAIRKACGESSWALIKARLTDALAWAMLAGVIYLLLPYFPAMAGM